ncbi:unnamed protein product [Linum tenue]|uniref:Secreted protein n=1 Tax=Linum tenue TaxID=586396 RepID=A0AAV0LNX1_9ROSI|nr:unnamed protein product [Linum tenue]
MLFEALVVCACDVVSVGLCHDGCARMAGHKILIKEMVFGFWRREMAQGYFLFSEVSSAPALPPPRVCVSLLSFFSPFPVSCSLSLAAHRPRCCVNALELSNSSARQPSHHTHASNQDSP